ncbi:MAG: ribosomal L7Ae/L30e/S12e/Gadd45 family protein [Clostridia bacterium]|nr:ribosomal L7Ae/L30e/S12e/Gadd45 family protein [Clostridia bacterium]
MNKVLTLLGFATKAGKLSYGFDATRTALSQKKSKLLLIANDVSPKSKKEILFFGEKFKTDAIVLENLDMATVSHAVGRKCGIISVNDTDFSNGLISAINAGRNLNDK